MIYKVQWMLGALFFLGPALAHFAIVVPMLGFVIWVVSAFLLFVSAIPLVLVAFRQRKIDLVGLQFVAMLPTVFIAGSMMSFGEHPRINDITTHPDVRFLTEDLGNVAWPQEFSEPMSAYGDLKPLDWAGNGQTLSVAADAYATENSNLAVVRVGENAVQLKYESTLFRFRDDLVAVVDGEQIQFRSRSRDGKSDFGMNYRHILSLKTFLAEYLTGR